MLINKSYISYISNTTINSVLAVGIYNMLFGTRILVNLTVWSLETIMVILLAYTFWIIKGVYIGSQCPIG